MIPRGKLTCIFQGAYAKPEPCCMGPHCKNGGGCGFGADIRTTPCLESLVRTLTSRAPTLRKVGIRHVKLMSAISKSGYVPTRGDIGADGIEGLEDCYCAALVPDM